MSNLLRNVYVRFYNDIHLRGVPQIMTFNELSESVKSSPYPVIFGGDIYDFSGCKVKELPQLFQEASILNDYVLNNGGFILEGNHTCYAYRAKEELLIENKILLIHGHRASWSKEKCEKFMSQEKGAGFFKRNFISRLVANLRRFKEVRPNNLFLKFIEEKKEQYPELKEIVCGHSHPPSIVEFYHAGVRVRIMPQGFHDLSFEI